MKTQIKLFSIALVLIGSLCGQRLSAQSNDKAVDFFNYPAAITPNGDGVNDVLVLDWKLNVDSFSIVVYNRWGAEEFASTDKNFSWDGTNKKGKKLPTGTYVFLVKCSYAYLPRNLTGSITVIH